METQKQRSREATETNHEPTNGTQAKRKPVQTIRLKNIRASIWENHNAESTWHNVTFSRLYRDQGGAWHSSDNFSRDDLLLVAKLADRAHTWVCEQHQTQGDEAH